MTAGLPLLGAVVLVLAATPVLDDAGWRAVVLPGAAVLVALALASAVDEPDAALLDASPTAFARRVLRRLARVARLVVPVALALLAWVLVVGGGLSPDLGRTSALLVLGAVALSAALRRWAGLAEPAVVTGPVLLLVLLLGRWLAPYLPDVEVPGALGWAVALAAAAGAVALGLRDPADARGARR